MTASRGIRFTDYLGAGASLVFGSAALLFSTAVYAGDNCTPASCTPTGPDCQQCQKVFEDAALKLKNLDPGSCTPNGCAVPAACAPTASACDPCNTDAVFGDTACGGAGGFESWTLLDSFTNACGQNTLKDNGFQIGGWTQIGYQNRPDGAFTGNGVFNNVYFGDAANLPNAREWSHLHLNQQGLYFGKVADGSNGVGFGFRVESIFGVDGNEAQSFGNPAGDYDFLAGYDHGAYEWALPQMYGEVAYENVSVKVGHFYTPVGYEVIPSGGNFFLSRQLTFYNSEPFTHTGALATIKVNDKLQVLSGWTLGMDTGFAQLAGGSSYLGGFIYQMTEKTNLTYMMTAGDLGWRGNGAINSAILTHNWSDKWSTVHQFDILGSDLGTDFATGGVAGDSIGQINYVFYQATDKVKLGARQEWYKADGVSYNTFTYGVNIKPLSNIVVRPEVRHMWSPQANNTVATPGRGDLFNATVFGIDAIWTY